jgi:hypothetical protein
MLNPLPVPTSRLPDAATTTAPVPAKLNACPTSPGLKPTLAVPELLSTISLALPSPGHQLTNPCGGFTHAAESRLGIIETAHANANIAIMYRFINRLSSLLPKQLGLLSFSVPDISWAYRSNPFYHALPIPSNFFSF